MARLIKVILNHHLTMDADEQAILIGRQFKNHEKRIWVAYSLLLVTMIGHNFYLGRTGRGIGQTVLILCAGIGVVWVMIDLFLLPGMVRKQKAIRPLATDYRLPGWSEIHRASAYHRNGREYEAQSTIMSADAERQKIMFKMLNV